MQDLQETAKKIASILAEDKAICRDLDLIFDIVKSHLTFSLSERLDDAKQTTSTINK